MAFGIAAADFFHPLFLVVNDRGMNNFVEFLYPRRDAWRRAAGSSKGGFGQPGTVDGSVRVQDFASKAADNFLVNRPAGLHERVRDRIGLNEVRAEFDEHLAHNRFAAGDTAGKAEFQHGLDTSKIAEVRWQR